MPVSNDNRVRRLGFSKIISSVRRCMASAYAAGSAFMWAARSNTCATSAGCQSFRVNLGVASRNHDRRFRVSPVGPPDELSRLVIRLRSNGAGIDNVDVGRLTEIDDIVVRPAKRLDDSGRFVVVDLAAQRGDGDFTHRGFPYL